MFIINHHICFSDFVKGRNWTTWLSCSGSVLGLKYSLDNMTSQAISSCFNGLPITPRHSHVSEIYPTPSSSRLTAPVVQVQCQRSASSEALNSESISSMLSGNTLRLPAPNWGVGCSDTILTISTNFNPSLKFNSNIRYPRNDKDQRFKYTEIQRRKAQNAVVAMNLNDFTAKVCHVQLF